MRRCSVLLPCVVLLSLAGGNASSVFAQTAAAPPAVAPGKFDRYLFPLSALKTTPDVTTDVSAAPETREWADKAAVLVREWFPHVCQLLATDSFNPPRTIRLVFKPNIGAPAYAAGDTITVDSNWITQHPDDFGMMIHELTHIIQAYPGGGNKPGWLVEGIADYVRWWRYEPEAPRPRINPETAKYTDSYRTTAAFLAWVSFKYDRGLVRQLDSALRQKTYRPEIFTERTGKSLDALWDEYKATLPPVRPAS
ncbi:MAG: hypothetical protein OHK0029_07450 [Armatimonadaceae bacterium]